ncbi:hypothetical protein BC937DRAFT_93150 [Endogone sp. FLAS-F59071]|nr:hypothetical protein BC937DRAFT_93150 [Endogone sp. FLAS-F59071]|eukprot:RUS14933.1 hypothetical protein BC937DRAFT_93150 [Endogone sp. FLAS-F59071]
MRVSPFSAPLSSSELWSGPSSSSVSPSSDCSTPSPRRRFAPFPPLLLTTLLRLFCLLRASGLDSFISVSSSAASPSISSPSSDPSPSSLCSSASDSFSSPSSPSSSSPSSASSSSAPSSASISFLGFLPRLPRPGLARSVSAGAAARFRPRPRVVPSPADPADGGPPTLPPEI